MYDPWQHAAQLGLRVLHVPHLEHQGLYCAGIIYLRAGLLQRVERCVLAHEIVHAMHGDEPTNDPNLYARREQRADREAARRLISDDCLRQVSAMSDDPGMWALELDVTGWILEARMKDYQWHT